MITAIEKTKEDTLTKSIVSYLISPLKISQEAYETAKLCLLDSLGCALLALNFSACTKLLGPIIPGTQLPIGSRIPGTAYLLDPIQAAFNLGAMIRWLDFNDTWLAAEWGHPSDNIGAILPICDYISQKNRREGRAPLLIKDLIESMVQAYEVQGILALRNSCNQIGIDHVFFVKSASVAVVTKLLGGTSQQIADALSQVWVDGGALRTYRHAPNTGSRKSWAAGDACRRAVQLAWITLQGEKGYTTPLEAPRWGLYDVLFQGRAFTLDRPLDFYVIENILFKVKFPAEFHAQTAVEAAIILHSKIKEKIDKIAHIEIHTQEAAMRIIDKRGPLKNPPDRDHCLQYMVAVALLKGNLTVQDYEEEAALDPQIDLLRSKMEVRENLSYSRDYLDPDKRSIANAITIYFQNGESIHSEVEYPIGHRRRRIEALPLLLSKVRENLSSRFSALKVEKILSIYHSPQFLDYPVDQFVELFLE